MTTGTVQEIENAIAALSEGEMQELYVWLEHHRPQPLDLRIEADFTSGRLDEAIREALDDGRSGRLRTL